MGNTVELNEIGSAPITAVQDESASGRTKGLTAPLSFAQQQIWLHAQLVPGLPIYNEPVTVQRRGSLDPAVLSRVLTEIVRRHQAWRTTFVLENGEPVQLISPAAEVQPRVVDLRHLSIRQAEAEAQKLADEDAIEPFNLSVGPLFRALLVHLSDNEHRLFLTLHHIIFDGYSIYRVLLPELAALYEAFSSGQASPLPELTTQYADFAAWEREWLLQGGRLESQLAYWREHLAGNLPVLQSPFDRTRPPVQSFRGAIQPIVFSKELTEGLKIVSRREGATLFMGLIAAFAVLLHRYSSSDDVAIGTVSSGRKRSELESLLGYFLNPVVLRNDLSGEPTFRELLRRTRETTLDALSNDDAPFPHVVHEVHPERSLSFHPLFQALLTLEPPVPATQDGWTVALTQSEVDTGFSKFDLCLELDDRPAGIVGRFKYSTDLFDAATVERMAGHLKTLLESIVADPGRRISQLEMLTPAERQQIAVEWNDTTAECETGVCIHDLFERQAALRPHAVAVVNGQQQLTYAELHQASRRMAAVLQQQGIGPEAPVGLYFEPSCEMLVAILAVLKAGGTCVPLDPSYPAERFSYVVADTELKILLTTENLRSQLPPHEAKVLTVSNQGPEAKKGDAIRKLARADNVAYLIYTSGSTGKPKGVQVTHANLVHSTQARFTYYGADTERFLLLSSFAFDSSLVGILAPLSCGGTVVTTPGPVQSNLTGLARLIDQHQITHLLCVPSMYSLLLEEAEPGQLKSLRVAIVAGESCPAELVRQHFELLPQVALFNEYGPTEAAVWSTVYRCEPSKPQKLVPIGRPIPNAKIYVLDSHLNFLPIGVPGELHVGGPGIARGYLNLPEETRERFIPDPFSDEPGARLYKTGDRVRYLPDGNLELLGRLDHQVKIRGFRIELEEIEAVIGEYQGVRQAVVTLRGANGESDLIAYVVPVNPSRFDVDNLRRFVAGKLPEAMVPAAFVLLNSLRLMPNGKVDREGLPTPPQNGLRKKFVAPHTARESDLIKVWETVLGKQGFGVTENFFDLGGHSLLVAKVLLRIEQQWGKRLSLADVFRAPTVRELAERLDATGESETQNPAIVPIQPRGSKPPVFWVRGGSFVLPLTKRLGLDQPVLGLHLPISDASHLSVPYKLEDIAAALNRRLREAQPQGPYYLAGLCVNGVIAYEMARQLVQQGHEIALLALFDAQNPSYYEDFSQESHSRLMIKRAAYQLTNLRRQRLTGFLGERLIGIRRRLSVRYWRIHNALGLSVNEKGLENLDSIVHPASFVYRPEPYSGPVVFFQSTDWPKGRYWDFHASWDGLIGGGMKVFRIRGGHESMFHEENVDLLSSKLQSCLSEAIQEHATERDVA